jgi:putative acetyltransferase
MRSILNIKKCSPFDQQVSNFIDALDKYQQQLYPPESNHLEPKENLKADTCCLLGCYKADVLIGIAAAKSVDGYGELKRFYVPEEFRGQSIAECLMAALEKWLKGRGVSDVYLETGIHQHAALRFYEKLGYVRCGPFGAYALDPLSVFMKKNISDSTFNLKSYRDGFYLVTFSSQLSKPSAKYSDIAGEMVQLAQAQDGFLAVNSVRNETGHGFTASYWRDLNSIESWGQNPRHLEAKKLGRTEFYTHFKTACMEGYRSLP